MFLSLIGEAAASAAEQAPPSPPDGTAATQPPTAPPWGRFLEGDVAVVEPDDQAEEETQGDAVPGKGKRKRAPFGTAEDHWAIRFTVEAIQAPTMQAPSR